MIGNTCNSYFCTCVLQTLFWPAIQPLIVLLSAIEKIDRKKGFKVGIPRVGKLGGFPAHSSQAATTEDSQKPLPLTFEAGWQSSQESMAEWSIPHFPLVSVICLVLDAVSCSTLTYFDPSLADLRISHGRGRSSIS